MLVRAATASIALLAISGSRDLPAPIGVGAHPADPSASVPRTRYRPVTEGTRDYEVVTPRPWVRSNEQVAPERK